MDLSENYEDTPIKWYRPEDVDEYITLLIWCSLAHCKTLQVPITFIFVAFRGFSIAGIILDSAAQ